MPKSFLLGGPLGPPPAGRLGAAAPVRRQWTGGGPSAGIGGSRTSTMAQRAYSNSKKYLPRVSLLPDTPPTPPEGYVGETLNDALDDLLREAAASLKHLDGIRGRLPKSNKREAGDFWRPRCRAELWSEADMLGELDSDEDSDASSRTSVGDIDAEEEGLWDFLRSAYNTPGSAKKEGTGRTSGPFMQSSSSRHTPPTGKAQAHQRWSSGVSSRGSEGAPPRATEQETKPPPKPAERARAQGFQFGSYGMERGRRAVGSRACADVHTPEAQITAALLKAQAEGPDAVKGTLRQLLLKWHPDKAPQGDSPQDVAAREEATRVLRHVLQEKKRLI